MSADPREGEIVVIPYGDGGESLATEGDAPANNVEELERTTNALRGNLSILVGELGRRGKRVLLPVAIGVGLLGAAGVAALVLSRRRQARKRTTFFHNLTEAARRVAAHPERVARPQPRGASRIAIAAGTAAASMVARRLVQRWLQDPSRPQTQPS